MTTLRRPMRALGALISIAALMVTTVTTVITAASGDAAAASKPPIKIGTTIWSLSSINLNDRYPAIKAAVRAINKSGGINGRKLQWIDCEELDANSAEACAREFVSDGVVATISDAVVNDEIAYGQILEQAGIPQLDPKDAQLQSWSNPNVYVISGGTPNQFGTEMLFAKLRGIKTFHFIEGVSTAASANMDTVRIAAKYYGIQEQGAPTAVPITAADYSPYAADAVSAGAGVNVELLAPAGVPLLLQAATQLGKPIVIGANAGIFTSVEYKTLGQSGGPLAKALLTDSLPPPSAAKDFPALQQYQRDLKAECKAGDDAACPDKVTDNATASWLVIHILADLAKPLKTVTAATIKHALNTAKNINMLGLLPPWTPSKKGPPGYERISNPWIYLVTVKNGQAVLFQTKPVNGLTPYFSS